MNSSPLSFPCRSGSRCAPPMRSSTSTKNPGRTKDASESPVAGRRPLAVLFGLLGIRQIKLRTLGGYEDMEEVKKPRRSHHHAGW
jgi:hypothetical protein